MDPYELAERLDDEYDTACTLPGGTCYCTGRAGCLAANEDVWDEICRCAGICTCHGEG